jgi:CDP-4-dehydro-6-deoxyglucose reductase
MPGGEFTDRLFAAMKVKEILRLEGPYGSFWLRDDTPKPIVLLASGTGFAPIKAVIEQMQLQGNTRPTRLYWGCRAKVDLYMDAWARAAEARMPNLRYIPVLSEPRDDDAWRGRLGLVHLAVLTDLPDLSGHQVYACGAPVMVHAAKRDFTTLGRLPEDEFHADAFTSAADKL